MATRSQKPNLADYDVRLLELAQQLDAAQLEIILQLAQDLIDIPYGTESGLGSLEISNSLLH